MQSVMKTVAVATLCFLLVFTTFGFTQGITTGSISGTVQDQQKAVVVGAKVSAVNTGTNTQSDATTNAAGLFRFANLPIGNYVVTIDAPGFQKLKISDITVNSGRESALGVHALSIGASEVVTVEGTAPMVEANSSQQSTTFDTRKAADLPVGNGFDSLALLIPGVVATADGQFSNSNGAGLSVNGQRGRSNNFQIDGQANNDNSIGGPSIFFGNQDAIAELQVVTNNFSAEYGRNLGSVVNYVTKGGTNAFHGTAYEFHTNSATSTRAAQDFRAGLDSAPRNLDNRAGATLGGPVIKDKIWFFGSTNWERQRTFGDSVDSGSLLTPTPAGLAQLAAAFPGNPAVAALQTIGPFAITAGNPVVQPGSEVIRTVGNGLTTAPIEFGTIVRALPFRLNNREFTARIDYQVTPKDRFFIRYVYQRGTNVNSAGRFAAGAVVNVPFKDSQTGLDWTRTITNTFFNQVRFSYSRADFGFEGGVFAGCNRGSITGGNLGVGCPTGISLGSTNLSFGMQSNLPQGRIVNNTQWQDNATWSHGRHTLKFGGEYQRQRSPNVFLPSILGTFSFSSSVGTSAGRSCASLLPAGTSGSRCAFSRFLANASTLTLADANTANFEFKELDGAAYFQDDWRIKDNLTLNLGVRYEINQQGINRLADITLRRELDPATRFWNPALPLDARTVAAVPNDQNNFGPNIGFAWTPKIFKSIFGEEKTVIRGGYRIAYDPAFFNIFLNVETAAPVVNLASIVGTGNFPSTGFLATDVRALNASKITRGGDPRFSTRTNVSPNFENPYTQQWSLGVQRTITSKIAGEVRYVGNHTVGNFQSINSNPRVTELQAAFPGLVPASVTACTDATAPGFGRIDCNRSLVRTRTNGAFSIYHGLQTRLDSQNWHGLTSGLSYTFSKTIDNASEIFSTFGGGGTSAFSQNPFDTLSAERGLSGISFKNVTTFYFIYDLPFFKSQQGVLGHILGGWQSNGIYQFNSGQPYTPIQINGESTFCDNNFSTTFNGQGDTCRPFLGNPAAAFDSVGQCTTGAAADCGIVDFFTGDPTTLNDVKFIINNNAAATFFGTPFGNLGRNTLKGQTRSNLDFSMYKNTKIGEKYTVQFQWNAFNLLNRQFRGVPDPVIDDGNRLAGGSFANTDFNNSNRRTMTFGLKVIF